MHEEERVLDRNYKYVGDEAASEPQA